MMNQPSGHGPCRFARLLPALFLGLLLLLPALAGAELKVYFLDVGQGDAVLVCCDGETLLVDAGPAEAGAAVNRFLRDTLGMDGVGCVIATHAHDDHLAGMAEALRGLTAGHIYSSRAVSSSYWFGTVLPVLRQDSLEVSFPGFQDSFSLGGAAVTFINPLSAAGNANDLSLAVRIEYGENTVLLTADIEAEAEAAILESGVPLRSTLLKVAHHGGDTSSTEAFIRAAAPEIAVISVGAGNAHGHPHPDPLRILDKYNVKVYRTDLFGTVVCTGDGTSWTTEVSKAR